jgi:hypothetical protein
MHRLIYLCRKVKWRSIINIKKSTAYSELPMHSAEYQCCIARIYNLTLCSIAPSHVSGLFYTARIDDLGLCSIAPSHDSALCNIAHSHVSALCCIALSHVSGLFSLHSADSWFGAKLQSAESQSCMAWSQTTEIKTNPKGFKTNLPTNVCLLEGLILSVKNEVLSKQSTLYKIK